MDRCYYCDRKGYMKLLCCVNVCNKCDKSNLLCGCYGDCDNCNELVNMKVDGYPCTKCNQWLCKTCKAKSKCKYCHSK